MWFIDAMDGTAASSRCGSKAASKMRRSDALRKVIHFLKWTSATCQFVESKAGSEFVDSDSLKINNVNSEIVFELFSFGVEFF